MDQIFSGIIFQLRQIKRVEAVWNKMNGFFGFQVNDQDEAFDNAEVAHCHQQEISYYCLWIQCAEDIFTEVKKRAEVIGA